MRKLLLLLLVLTFAIACTPNGGPYSNNAKKKLTIAVIPKGTTHEFWKSIHAGANKAASEAPAGKPVEILWKGPLKEDDSDAQIAVVENMIALGVQGIVLAPNDRKALSKVVDKCATKNIPVVII